MLLKGVSEDCLLFLYHKSPQGRESFLLYTNYGIQPLSAPQQRDLGPREKTKNIILKTDLTEGGEKGGRKINTQESLSKYTSKDSRVAQNKIQKASRELNYFYFLKDLLEVKVTHYIILVSHIQYSNSNICIYQEMITISLVKIGYHRWLSFFL